MNTQAVVIGFSTHALAGSCHGRPGLGRALGAGMLLACALLGAGAIQAGETMLLNESAAEECYRSALRGADARDIEDCNLALDHQALKSIDYAATLSNRGLLLTRSDRFDEALHDHDRAIGIRPDFPSFYVNRSNTYTRAHRYEEAMQDLDRAIELATRARESAERTAAAAPPPVGTSAGGGVEAIVPGIQVLAAAHYNRALLFHRKNELAAAIADARRASELVPDRGGYRAYVEELERASAQRPFVPAG